MIEKVLAFHLSKLTELILKLLVMQDFATEIREAVQELHQQIESTYLAFRMMHGIISKPEYSWILAQLYYLHRFLEPTWQADSTLSGLFDLNKYSRLQIIQADLNLLVNGDMPPVDPTTQKLLQQTSAMYQENKFSLIGVLYVLEGSRLGSVYLTEPLMNALSLQDTTGAGFFLCTPEPWYKDWYRFKESINQIDHLPQQFEGIKYAAVKTFEGMIELYQTKPA